MTCDLFLLINTLRAMQAEDCANIDALNRNHRYNNPGDFANYPIYD